MATAFSPEDSRNTPEVYGDGIRGNNFEYRIQLCGILYFY